MLKSLLRLLASVLALSLIAGMGVVFGCDAQHPEDPEPLWEDQVEPIQPEPEENDDDEQPDQPQPF